MRTAQQILLITTLAVDWTLAQDDDAGFLIQGPPPASSLTSPSTFTPLSSSLRAPISDGSTTSSSAGTGDDGHRDGLLNYYFLIIAVFVVILIIIYYSLSRRRRLAQIQSQTHQADALNRDLLHPSNHQRGMGGWRRWRPGGQSRDATHGTISEGLNECGEAPPPYIKEPGRVHLASRGSQSTHDMELGDWSASMGKPPDYNDDRRAGHG